MASPAELVDVVNVGVGVGVCVVELEAFWKLSVTVKLGETAEGGLVEEESLAPPELPGDVGCVVSFVVIGVVGGMTVVEDESWEVVACSGVGWAGGSVDLVGTFDGPC